MAGSRTDRPAPRRPPAPPAVTVESQTAGLMRIMRRGLRMNSAAGLSAARRALMDIGALHGLAAAGARKATAAASSAALQDLWQVIDAIEDEDVDEDAATTGPGDPPG